MCGFSRLVQVPFPRNAIHIQGRRSLTDVSKFGSKNWLGYFERLSDISVPVTESSFKIWTLHMNFICRCVFFFCDGQKRVNAFRSRLDW